MVGHRMSFTPVAQLCLATSQCCLCMQPLTKQAAIASRPCSQLSRWSLLPGGGEALLHRAGCLSMAAGFPSSGLPPDPVRLWSMNSLVGQQ